MRHFARYIFGLVTGINLIGSLLGLFVVLAPVFIFDVFDLSRNEHIDGLNKLVGVHVVADRLRIDVFVEDTALAQFLIDHAGELLLPSLMDSWRVIPLVSGDMLDWDPPVWLDERVSDVRVSGVVVLESFESASSELPRRLDILPLLTSWSALRKCLVHRRQNPAGLFSLERADECVVRRTPVRFELTLGHISYRHGRRLLNLAEGLASKRA